MGASKDVKMGDEEEEKMMPFMDTFYSLASNESSERSYAASCLIRHIFSKEGNSQENIDETVTNGSYALTRLLNGLCSGRAGARQGFASCLTSFLKISFTKTHASSGDDDDSGRMWIDLFMKKMGEEEQLDGAEFIQKKLRDITVPTKGQKNQGKKTEAEKKDHKFGLLFGILAIVRSGTLAQAPQKILKVYIQDLVGLYNDASSKFFRQPAVHALKEFFSFVSASSGMSDFGDLVQSVSYFFNFEHKTTFTAEKFALYLHLQTIYLDNDIAALPKCLENALLTTAMLCDDDGKGIMKHMLGDATVTAYPKSHLLWSSINSYLSKQNDDSRTLRETFIGGKDSAPDIIEALINNVIIEDFLLRKGKFAFGPRALSISLIRQFCSWNLPKNLLKGVILKKFITTKLFMNIPENLSGALKPIILENLEAIANSFCSKGFNEESIQRRFEAVQAFLAANVAFDNVTKTRTISRLLGLDGIDEDSSIVGRQELLELYFELALDQTLEHLSSDEPDRFEATKYIDLIVSFTKKIIRVGTDDERSSVVDRALHFMMIGAFFDLQELDTSSVDGKSPIGIISTASQIKSRMKLIPHGFRVIMSSRFFGLLTDYIEMLSHQDGKRSKMAKVQTVLSEVSRVNGMCSTLQDWGAVSYNDPKIESPEEMNDDVSSVTLVAIEACKRINSLTNNDQESADSNALNSIAAFAMSLRLQLLHPGQPESDDVMEDAYDDDDFSENVLDTINDLCELAFALAGEPNSEDKSGDEDEGENAISALALICVEVLRSPFGGSDKQATSGVGGVSKLVQDCLQVAWKETLALVGSASNRILDAEVINILLEAVCSPNALAEGQNKDSTDDTDISEGSDDVDMDSENDDEVPSFSGMDDEASDSENDAKNDGDMGNDIELDSSKLENLLIESSDDDESVDGGMLEHHAGADAALAQLIKLKQDARKSGKEDREKSELMDRMHCIHMLEAVFRSNKGAPLLSNQVTLMVILPLLRTRRELVKSIASAAMQRKGNLTKLKKDFVSNISKLLVGSVCKTKLDGMANADSCGIVAEQVLLEAKRVEDNSHSECCGALLFLLVKASSCGDQSPAWAQSISDAFADWSMKKSSKFQRTLFSRIEKDSRIATSVLLEPLVNASEEACNEYRKCESFKMLTALYRVAPSSEPSTDADIAVLKKAAIKISASLSIAMVAADLDKMKWTTILIDAAGAIVNFAKVHGDQDTWSALSDLRVSVLTRTKESESNAIQKKCKTLESRIAEGIKLQEEKNAAAEKEAVQMEVDTPSSKKSKKKTKKSKKKKRK